jgi:hypothetical protein
MAGAAIGIVGTLALSPSWLAAIPAGVSAAALAHTLSRFHLKPFVRFLMAWFADIPMMGAYVIGRTVGIAGWLRR